MANVAPFAVAADLRPRVITLAAMALIPFVDHLCTLPAPGRSLVLHASWPFALTNDLEMELVRARFLKHDESLIWLKLVPIRDQR
jgi:hypothetical protein